MSATSQGGGGGAPRTTTQRHLIKLAPIDWLQSRSDPDTGWLMQGLTADQIPWEPTGQVNPESSTQGPRNYVPHHFKPKDPREERLDLIL